MMGRSTYGAGGAAYTVAGSEDGPVTPATVCATCTTWPVASGADSVSDHVPSDATVAVPKATVSIATVTTPATTPVPLTCVTVATSGRWSAGAGGDVVHEHARERRGRAGADDAGGAFDERRRQCRRGRDRVHRHGWRRGAGQIDQALRRAHDRPGLQHRQGHVERAVVRDRA